MKITELLISEQTIQPVGTIQQGGITPMPATIPTQAPGQISSTATNTASTGQPVPPGQQMGRPATTSPPGQPALPGQQQNVPAANPANAAQAKSLSAQIAQLQARLAALNTQS